MVRDLREICRNSPINVTIFHPYFVFFDQFELVRPTTIQCMGVGAVIMMIISFIFIPNLMCALFIAISVISIAFGVVGYMALWDVNLDSISMINLIMCIGFSIDFSAHICYVYMSSNHKKPEERVREALYSLGLPIVQGSTSTILGVLALLFAESYIFLVFFKMVFLVIFFGAMHGLFLLPVLLSLFGPNSCSSIDDKHSDDGINFQHKDKKAVHPFTITHPHLMMASSPNGIYNNKSNFSTENFKGFRHDEKDLGIGTSSEDSSENSSSKSQKRKALDDENVKRRYEMGWRKSSQTLTPVSPVSPSTFTPGLDIYGNKYEDFWNSADNLSNSKRDDFERSRDNFQMFEERDKEEKELAKNTRKKQPLSPDNNEKKLYYYDYKEKRKHSDDSYKNSEKYINTRRNIV